MGTESREVTSATSTECIDVRLSRRGDLPRILEISNWAIQHTAANFKTEPEALADWAALWDATHEKYPWFIGHCKNDVVGFALGSPFKGR